MCDLLFEIAAKDDDAQKTVKIFKETHFSMDSTKRGHTFKGFKGHFKFYFKTMYTHHSKRLLSLCIASYTWTHGQMHCKTKGHVKDVCGKLGYFPGSHYKA